MARVQAAIDAGIFRRADFFASTEQPSLLTFEAWACRWLENLTGAKSTKRSYRNAIKGTWIPALGDKALDEIVHTDIKAVIAGKAASVSGKTVNNLLIPLRGAFDDAVHDRLIAVSPAAAIENLAHQSPQPDPFEREEMEAILQHMAERYAPEIADYYTIAFQTGLRPSEQIVAAWPKVDFRRAQLRVDTARVDWEQKDTKTHAVRDVDLSDVAMTVLRHQKTRTFLAGGPIFHNPTTGLPWADEQTQRRSYFNPTLKALGIRHRDAYQTRHTFATLALMGGVNPAYIARQLGHKDAQMVFRRYAKWIDGADKGEEARKLNAVLSRKSPRATLSG